MSALKAIVLFLFAVCMVATTAFSDHEQISSSPYTFEIQPTPDHMKRGNFGAMCILRRNEADGSKMRFLCYSNGVAEYLRTMQFPVVTLTFYRPEGSTKPIAPKINGLDIQKLHGTGSNLFYILEREKDGKKTTEDSGAWAASQLGI